MPQKRPTATICLLVLLPVLLAACATTAPPGEPVTHPGQQSIDALQLAIEALSDEVDPEEARRAATIAIEYPLQLAQEYEITQSPLTHNFLVNIGAKPRGLCIHWTWDLYARLQQERFRSLDLHWGIANYQSAFRLEHSTVILSAHGDSLEQGLVMDPWRQGGPLFWAKTLEDPDYRWYPHADIHALKRERKALASNQSEQR